jgi:hypothetical protein
MRTEKQKSSTKKYKEAFDKMNFDERVLIHEMSNGLLDPDVVRANNFFGQQKIKQKRERSKAVIAIMKMRGIEL